MSQKMLVQCQGVAAEPGGVAGTGEKTPPGAKRPLTWAASFATTQPALDAMRAGGGPWCGGRASLQLHGLTADEVSAFKVGGLYELSESTHSPAPAAAGPVGLVGSAEAAP